MNIYVAKHLFIHLIAKIQATWRKIDKSARKKLEISIFIIIDFNIPLSITDKANRKSVKI